VTRTARLHIVVHESYELPLESASSLLMGQRARVERREHESP
jgi:hypothetical protein